MAGLSRLKDGVASARLCPGHPRLSSSPAPKNVDARDKPGYDEKLRAVARRFISWTVPRMLHNAPRLRRGALL